MKKFTLSRVLDGFRSSVNQPGQGTPPGGTPGKNEQVPLTEIPETLRTEHFTIAQTVCHGFPYQPTVMAFDPVQRLLAVGTKNGYIRILGRPGVDIHIKQDSPDPSTPNSVVHLQFVINEGLLIAATTDDTIHLWNFKESKKPEIIQSLKFQRERITSLILPFQSKWFYVGTERGNVHVVNIDTFQLSGYVVNWNKAIDVSRKTHPGCVIFLGDNPVDSTKLLIGFDSGQLVLWDLKLKAAEMRWQSAEPLRSVSWHSDGKMFMGSHSDGSVTTWNVKNPGKPVALSWPHARPPSSPTCKSIQKLEWKSSRTGENFVIFSGGLTADRAGKTPSLTVIHGKTTTVLEMEHNVLDFVTICEGQWDSEIQDPYAVIVLLQQDLVVIDLLTPGYPCFENPYPMDIHESPVTCCTYLADCPGDLIPALYSCGSKGVKKCGFSEREWPVDGGCWGASSCSYAEIIVTGHADGSVKFWDASSTSLQVLYKLKTTKPFERPKKKSTDSSPSDDDPFAVQHLALCPESRLLATAGASSQVLVYKFRKQETSSETTVLEIPIIWEAEQEAAAAFDFSKVGDNKPEYFTPLRTKPGPQKRAPGYQLEFVCVTPWINGEPPSGISSLALNSGFGILAYGNESGLVIVDVVQRLCLLSIATPDLYGSADPYQRAPKSPSYKKQEINEEKSPSEQMDGLCLSPTRSGDLRRGQRANKSTGRLMRAGLTKQSYSMAGQENNHHNQQNQPTPAVSLSNLPTTTPPTPPTHKLLASNRMYCSFGGAGGASGQLSVDYKEKLDTTFSRSRSSSMSSLDNISSEAIQCLAFVESFVKKGDFTLFPTLWVGTSLGSIVVISLTLPTSGGKEGRRSEPVAVTPSGTIFRIKGSILMMTFLDMTGGVMGPGFEAWRDDGQGATRTPTKGLSSDSEKGSPCDRQFAVFLSEKQARVVSLPSHSCLYKQQICEGAFIIKGEVTSVKDSSCLVCYASDGHLKIYSLPSLRPLLDVDFVPLSDLSFHQTRKSAGGIVDPMLSIWGQQIIVNEDTTQIAKTFCLSSYGHGMYLSSPSEIQKFTVASDFCQNLEELLGKLFIEIEMPEKPKESFFAGLFGVGVRNVDREELFGEAAAGKTTRSVATKIPGAGGSAQQEHLQMRAGTVASDVARTRMMMVERGQKLGDLGDKTEKMMNESENFSSAAHQLMLKYKDKKWYQL